MSWEEVCHFIAQGAINITEGHTTIEAGSPVHKAMTAFCEYVNLGRVKYTSNPGACINCGSVPGGCDSCREE